VSTKSAPSDHPALDQRVTELEQRVERLEGRAGRTHAEAPTLTGRQRRIAALVATGLTNAETAAALSVSPKTVEWNLSRIYRALGVRSRTELTIRLGAHGAWPDPGHQPGGASRAASRSR
jgi:DNA-binding NarL/FixJ family response regulator